MSQNEKSKVSSQAVSCCETCFKIKLHEFLWCYVYSSVAKKKKKKTVRLSSKLTCYNVSVCFINERLNELYQVSKFWSCRQDRERCLPSLQYNGGGWHATCAAPKCRKSSTLSRNHDSFSQDIPQTLLLAVLQRSYFLR